jgi:chaperonin cofactor prefoldin
MKEKELNERFEKIEKRLDVIEKALKAIATAAKKAHEEVKLSKWDD